MSSTNDIAAALAGKKLALPQGSLILVTGASGYIGAHVVNEALAAGYKVRGTARSQEKCDNTKKIFKNHPNYSTAIVSDFQHAGAFDEAVQGCDAVIHVASDTTFSTEWDKVVKPVVDGVLSILRSAAKTPSVKRFVLTSSSAATCLPKPNVEFTLTTESWNQEAVDLAKKPGAQSPEQGFIVYAASKTEGERALWKFMKDENPTFVANAVLPNWNMGRIISTPGATGGAIPELLEGKLRPMPPQYHIDVIDDARLHIIPAVLDANIQNERIFAFNVPFNWTEIINIMKELRPDAKLPSPPENEPRDLSKVPNERGAKLLKEWYGQDGFKSLKQSVKENLEGF